MLFGLSDPLFPAIQVEIAASGGFQAAGLSRKNWSTATPIRKIFREAFENAGLTYFPAAQFPQNLGSPRA